MNTPEFLMWAVEFSCPVRGFQDGSDPERTERQLRAVRAVSDAEREGKVFEGVAVRGEEGFRIDEALGVYGGREAVEAACGNCPADVLAYESGVGWAGCYGMVVRPSRSEWLERVIDEAIERETAAGEIFTRTRPGWYGLWMQPRLSGKRAGATARILDSIERGEWRVALGLKELAWALRRASTHGLPVHVELYPEGSVDAGYFVLSPHCPQCKLTWPTREKQVCSACGYEGFSAPVRKRRARGGRPYRPLARLLGELGAREFLSRYAAQRAQ